MGSSINISMVDKRNICTSTDRKEAFICFFRLVSKTVLTGIIPDTTTSFLLDLIDEARLAISYATYSGCSCLLKSFVPQWIIIASGSSSTVGII